MIMVITIFLADDHPIVREGLRFLLASQSDFEVVGQSNNGRDTVRQVAKLRPHIVLMDIGMLELNGIEATGQILEHSPGTQVIMLSMYATVKYIINALEAGAQGYLLKESAGNEVVDAIRTVHGGRRYFSQKIRDNGLDEYLEQQVAPKRTDPLAHLSPREREVLQLVVEGKTSFQIAEILYLSPKTVESYRSRLMQKLKIKDIPGLVKFAIQNGLTPLE
jgi:DNA-binding NarL/FixJ family response regulator